MRVCICCFFSMVLFSCVGENNKSAFTGEVQKRSGESVGFISGQSIYQLEDTFQNQDNKQVTLSLFEGEPVIVAMIFTHCDYACPQITADMKNIENKLKGNHTKVRFLLVSFDTERDFPAILKKYAVTMGLDESWTLLHGSQDAVRMLSVLLNVQFTKSGTGNFAHSNIISVLDQRGVLRFQKEGLGVNPDEIIRQIEQLIQ